MNISAVSAECAHRMHSSCDYEDCACECHEPDEDGEPDQLPPEEEYDL
jgi:hypothetical protein